ncbi:MAG: cysteine desulfurase CsdA [Pelagibacterales bacterium]|nr:cysteine desulfurase CsdA [Pelagibacterales bacterium]PPR16331.1 MAG: Cysteine desulfurase SufS [Alphaproteobacteria bacterium MarineAlpha9_Bin3]|tara:strand:+ start:1649 stop:2881 length:1233 start_codon:yes stop_codon:yes gene_type:complete
MNKFKNTFYSHDVVKSQFPIFDKNDIIYLDSAASSQKPRSVLSSINEVYSNNYANIHRGVYKLSQTATDMYEDAREIVRKFVNAESVKEIIFVRGATEAINLVASTVAEINISEGDEIILSRLEHHSNIVPWQIMAKKNKAIIKVAESDENGDVSFESIFKMVTPKTKFISVTHISNAIGSILPVKDICKEAKSRGILTLIDGCQAAPLLEVDVQDIGCDFYVFSGHKTYGPTGIGVLYGREDVLNEAPPYQGGGDMIDKVTFKETTYAGLPSKFEAGTPNIVGAIGLGSALTWMQNIGINNINEHSRKVVNEGLNILESINGIKIIGKPINRGGVISFIYKDIHSHDLGTLLNSYNIAVRTGHHCAQPTMERYKVSSTVRASVGYYNNKEDFEALAEGILKVSKVFENV